MVTRALERAGYQVVEAGTGKVAVNVLRRHPGINVVISDVYMPDMDGFEFLMQMSSQVGAPNIIVMSGGGNIDRNTVLEIAERLGARCTLEKALRAG
jgi:CheY-like chemotaxis protein